MAKTIILNNHHYTVVNAGTEQARRMKRAFDRSTDVELRDAYGRYSREKEHAYEYCRDREREFGSYNGVITGHNSCQFSYAFTGKCEGKWWLIYITKDHDYAIELEEWEA